MRGRNRRRSLAAAGAGLLVAVTSGCGVPGSSSPLSVASGDVPYGLLEGSRPGRTATTTPGVPVATATIYLADAQQRLVAVPVQVTQAPLVPLVQTLLDRLAAGLTDPERAGGLVTNLGPGSTLVLRGVSFGTAMIELQNTSQDARPSKLPVAVGQIVLTATSVVGVDRVAFVRAGEPFPVPGPTDELTADPLTAGDYSNLLAPGQPSIVRTVPLASSSASPTTTQRG